MPQFTLTDGELVKKTMRTTLVMVGATTLWLGALTGAVVLTTPSSSADASESKVEGAARGGSAAPVPASAIKGPTGKPGGRHGGASSKGDSTHAGDPI